MRAHARCGAQINQGSLRAAKISPREAGHPDSPRALRRDAVSCKAHPKIQPAKLHPQIGYRRFTPASGGQVPWVRRRPRRHTAQLRPRGTGSRATTTTRCPNDSPTPRVAGGGQAWAVNGCPRPQKMRTWTTWAGVDHVGCVAALRKSVPVVPIRITGQRPCAAKISPRGTAPRCRNLVGAGQPSVLCPLIGDEILRTGAAVASSKPCLVIEPR